MISRSDPAGPRAGATLLEVLVVLAILAGITALVLSSNRGPSPQLVLQQEAQKLRGVAVESRLQAISTRTTQTMADLFDCDGQEAELFFFPNGSVSGPDICLEAADQQVILTVDGPTGRLTLKEVEE